MSAAANHTNGGFSKIRAFLQFEGGVVGAVRRFGWASDEWPPPERMGVAVGRLSGEASVFDPDNLPPGIAVDDVEQVAQVTLYRRSSASNLPADMDNERLLRGALYRPEK